MVSRISVGSAVCILLGAALAACGSNSSPTGYSSTDAGSTPDGTTPVLGADAGGPSFADGSGLPDHASPTGCDPSCGAAGGQCQGNVCVIVDNPGNVDPGTQGMLKGGGKADPGFAWQYPYDGTVFPRGLLPPTLQFGGGAPDAAYVHVTFSGMDYQGFYGPSNPGRVSFSPLVWSAITLAATAGDAVKVDVTKISGGAVSGPVTESWTIAQGSLRGSIYYETYDSQLAGGVGSVGIMQIQPGAKQPTVVKTGCGNVCHTASADGSTLVANVTFGAPGSSASYDLKSGASIIHAQPDQSFTYGALYPDGSLLMSATSYRTWIGGFPGLGGGGSSLYDSHSGVKIPAPGWDGTVTNAGTPAFSPDGKHIAFNREDTAGGHTLSVMDFDVATKTFSKLIDIATDPSGTVAWPAFTPDGKWLVYHSGSSAAFETDNGATGDVFIVDLATRTVHRLDSLDGYKGSGSPTYLPASDPALSFAPTVLPEAVGGYYWIVFTSHRSYGNTLPSKDNNDEYGKLWVAALDLSPAAGKDASHPAFYLDGQEAKADNLRGFWVLSPCKGNGAGCTSGDECCGGFCRGGDAGGLVCVPPPATGCSQEYEKCNLDADCCGAAQGYQCINGRCASPPAK